MEAGAATSSRLSWGSLPLSWNTWQASTHGAGLSHIGRLGCRGIQPGQQGLYLGFAPVANEPGQSGGLAARAHGWGGLGVVQDGLDELARGGIVQQGQVDQQLVVGHPIQAVAILPQRQSSGPILFDDGAVQGIRSVSPGRSGR